MGKQKIKGTYLDLHGEKKKKKILNVSREETNETIIDKRMRLILLVNLRHVGSPTATAL